MNSLIVASALCSMGAKGETVSTFIFMFRFPFIWFYFAVLFWKENHGSDDYGANYSLNYPTIYAASLKN